MERAFLHLKPAFFGAEGAGSVGFLKKKTSKRKRI
jgi:hypothetical protein